MKPPDLRDQLRYAYDPQFRGLHQLMARRVRTILMVSSSYESFSLSRDYSLTQEIYGASGDYVVGANIAGFVKVADSMLAQGLV